VQQSRGRLEIDSTPGNGTTIRMLFPSATEDQPDNPGTKHATISAHTDGARSGAHILIVEDSAEVLALAREILEGVGYRVSTAETGEAALELFEGMPSGTLDLLFTDLIMPGGINGIVLAGEVARRAPNLPVLMTTGYNEELVAEGPMRAGLDVLGKPYRRSDLLDRVRQALNRGSASGGD
ncbi:hybrid sensor histidine kinase/response regulator, partial [Stenotrophomonas sp. HMWF022]